MARILSLGSALQDIYLIDRDDFGSIEYNERSLFKSLEIGSKYDIDKMRFFIGGGGTNSAYMFARSGHEAFFIGNLGKDPAGEAVLHALDYESIDTSYVCFPARGKTGCSVILLDSKTGERTILTFRGSSARFDNLDPQAISEIKPDWIYITTLRGDFGTLNAFLELARRNHTRVMFNPGVLEIANPALLRSTLSQVDILLLNKQEAATLVPGILLDELLTHLRYYAPAVIITDGAMGGLATDGAKTYRFGIYEDVKVKDTTGAGDAFGSAFLASLAHGYSFRKSLMIASANSTSVIQHLGAKDGILGTELDLHPMPIQLINQE